MNTNAVFYQLLDKTISHATRNQYKFAVLIIKLNHDKIRFDVENQQFLNECMARITLCIRDSDAIALLDDNSIAILLNDLKHVKYAGKVATKIIEDLETSINIGNSQVTTAVNIGISIFPDDCNNANDLLVSARNAAYQSLSLASNLYTYHNSEMNIESHEHIKIENALKNGLKNNQFEVYFQPQYALDSKTFNRVEALLRWIHPDYGFIHPEAFIAIAEGSRLILDLSVWTIRQVCALSKKWQLMGITDFTVSINISPVQFELHDIDVVISDALKEFELEANHLEIEITETSVMKDEKKALIILNKLRKMGVFIAIDDFGSGYTSISQLRAFPINTLKIDKTYIDGMLVNHNDAVITDAIIKLGHNLGLKVIAEGIENMDQEDLLMRFGCDYVQGFYYSKPLSESELIEVLLANNSSEKKET